MKRIAVLVSNDLVHDQRVRKTCEVFLAAGLEVTLVGRKLPDSEPIDRPYETHRFEKMRWSAGFLFYLSLQWRLLRYLYRHRKRFDAVWANDLDTLLPAYLVAKRRRWPLIYDSHEYFTEAAGLTGRPFPKFVWTRLEAWVFPKLRHVFTVNDSIARIYEKKYKVKVGVVRNMPLLTEAPEPLSRRELGLPEGKLLILQGAFMDKDRGVLEAVRAMQFLDDVHLLLVGAGEEWEKAGELSNELGLDHRITRLPKQPFERLRQFTASADVGLSLDKAVHFNYLYSLPNKLFDYIHAGTPVLASPLPEVQKVVETYKLGRVIHNWEPEHIAAEIRHLLDTPKSAYSGALRKAASELNWQSQTPIILEALEASGVLPKTAS